jgi:hypothetical protein
LKNVQILKIFGIFKKEKNEKRKGNEKLEENSKTRKPEKNEEEKSTHKKEKPTYAALTGRPFVTPTRAKRSSAPLMGGA